MIVDTEQTSRVASLRLPEWSAAEILDTSLSEDLKLRAIVCRLSAGKWQWSITSFDRERAELISAGVERSIGAARSMATAEIAKCVESAID
jgi:hypothetical protein